MFCKISLKMPTEAEIVCAPSDINKWTSPVKLDSYSSKETYIAFCEFSKWELCMLLLYLKLPLKIKSDCSFNVNVSLSP